MQRHGHHMADHDKRKAIPTGRDALVNDTIPKPCPEEDLAGELEPSVPPCWPLPWTQAKDNVFPAQTIQVEAAHGEDGVIQVVLVVDEELCKYVVGHDAVVIG